MAQNIKRGLAYQTMQVSRWGGSCAEKQYPKVWFARCGLPPIDKGEEKEGRPSRKRMVGGEEETKGQRSVDWDRMGFVAR